MNHPIEFVSLGPGEPELITLKGLKALQQADCIFCPATTTREGNQVSRATDIMQALDIPLSVIKPFNLPMSKERGAALAAYDQVYEEAKTRYGQQQRVVIVAEGDAGFYSSIQYIFEKLQTAGIPAQRIAGIPAFIAAGAVITKNVKPYALMAGVPAKQIGWMSQYGEQILLPLEGEGEYICPHTAQHYQLNDDHLTEIV